MSHCLKMATIIEVNYLLSTLIDGIKRINKVIEEGEEGEYYPKFGIDYQKLNNMSKNKQRHNTKSQKNTEKMVSLNKESTSKITIQNKNNSLNILLSKEPISVETLKIGFIGCGVINRLLLNSILVFQKEGIQAENIYVSTRQYEDLEHYRAHFGINIDFDNESIVEFCDVVIVGVPSSLDNWVINDLKEGILTNINSGSIKPNFNLSLSNLQNQGKEDSVTSPVTNK